MLLTLQNLYHTLPAHHRLLGVDPGKKRIGLALSDLSLMLASPYKTIKRGKISQIAQDIQALQSQEALGGMVIGFPLNMDGTIGPAAQAVKDWAAVLAQTVHLPFCLWDERLSSAAVNRMLIEDVDVSRQRREELVDKLAATYILQSALDSLVRT
ncbi:Holliday junction resolvase RuvX [Entomobacter blattae]|uniref:Putative pre-16S rRNA nuclease n=1 Tax=Entomobacter blattae TaxID=2762277 RepID=A0A7H1NS44_9PROT|nr:Holliday junction resolvase RuvX [Entomobacter blattae]QNT78604.1 Putative pre-16S rRNA nuclease [Entomobacter blattae]